MVDSSELASAMVSSCRMLVELWILADRFMMSALQNHTIETLNEARLNGKLFTAGTPGRIYENTNENSQLRSCFLDVCIEGMSDGFRDTGPPQFLVDIINGMRARLNATKEAGWEAFDEVGTFEEVDESISCRGGQ